MATTSSTIQITRTGSWYEQYMDHYIHYPRLYECSSIKM